jgi:hypothetical protein
MAKFRPVRKGSLKSIKQIFGNIRISVFVDGNACGSVRTEYNTQAAIHPAFPDSFFHGGCYVVKAFPPGLDSV